MSIGECVIRLKDGRYWISPQATTGNIDDASKYKSRWVALAEMNRAGPIMHEAAIVDYLMPSQDKAEK